MLRPAAPWSVFVGETLVSVVIFSLPFLAVFPLCAFQFAMLLAIEFPDATGDAAAGKRTLVVRLGAARAATLHQAVMAVAYLSLPFLVTAGLPAVVAIAAAAPAPLAAGLFRRGFADRQRRDRTWCGPVDDPPGVTIVR